MIGSIKRLIAPRKRAWSLRTRTVVLALLLIPLGPSDPAGSFRELRLGVSMMRGESRGKFYCAFSAQPDRAFSPASVMHVRKVGDLREDVAHAKHRPSIPDETLNEGRRRLIFRIKLVQSCLGSWKRTGEMSKSRSVVELSSGAAYIVTSA